MGGGREGVSAGGDGRGTGGGRTRVLAFPTDGTHASSIQLRPLQGKRVLVEEESNVGLLEQS